MKKAVFRIIFPLFAAILLCHSVSAAQELVPGGQIIGLSLADDTLTIASIDKNLGKNAETAGLKAGDRLTQVEGQSVHSIEDVRDALDGCGGTVRLSILRDGKRKQIQLSPTATSEGPRLGIYLKEGITGIGTVTYYDPQTGTYGALGHGVNTADGQLLTMRSGSALPATILSVRMGTSGKPGQLVGALTGTEPIGTIAKNTAQGIFGTAAHNWQGQTMPVADASQIHTGEATIRSTIDDHTVQEYSVEILKIYPNSRTCSRNMLLKITDPALLSTTGGIVQGMSGSPIIQDGKLIGAVTHVLVNDPQTGYGIFIENMLDAAA